MALSRKEIEKVNARLFDPFRGHAFTIKRTDAALVMGGRSTSGAAAREAAKLYRSNFFPKIIVAGGARIFQPDVFLGLAADGNTAVLNPQTLRDIFTLKAEAHYMADVLKREGVPANDIIIAGENEKHADGIIASLKTQLIAQFASAHVITYAPYTRRIIGTLRHQGVAIPLESTPVNVFGLNPGNWHTSRLAGLITTEANNMDPDNPEGYIDVYCSEVDFDEEFEKLRNLEVPVLVR